MATLGVASRWAASFEFRPQSYAFEFESWRAFRWRLRWDYEPPWMLPTNRLTWDDVLR